MKLKITKSGYLKLVGIVTGIVATLWFIVRVVPKPSRALYPCQRAAFPVASSFIIWLTGSIASVSILKRSGKVLAFSKYRGLFILFSGLVLFLLSYMFLPSMASYASKNNIKEELPVVLSEKSVEIDTFKSSVAIIKSEKAQVSQITAEEIQDMVEQAVEMAGGLDGIVHDGDTVVLKPNLVCDYNYADSKKLTPGANGIATDYRVIQAVVNIVNELNPSGKIFLVEGSAKGNTMQNMKTVGWDQITGIDKFIGIEESSGTWYEYNSPNLVGVDLPDSISLYPDNIKPNKTRTIYQNKIYYNADVLICLPVLKNHFYTGITGSVKCVGIGGTPGKIYGTGKSDVDSTQRYGIDHDNRTNLHKWIHDFYACRPIDFVVMDGLQGSDNGPVAADYTSLSQAQRNMRIILAGKDPIALDAVESLIMGHDPQKIPHLVYLNNHGFGCVNPALIEVLGTQVEDIRVDFKTGGSGSSSKFYTFTSADYSLGGISFTQDEVILSVADTLNLGRVEITIDKQKYKSMIIGRFNHISVPLSGFSITDSLVEVLFVDKYLNTLEKSYSGSFTGISSHLFDLTGLNVYPIPAKNDLYIKYPDTFSGQFAIEIWSADGKKVLTKTNCKETNNRIDISSLKAGQYILCLKQKSNVARARFFKM